MEVDLEKQPSEGEVLVYTTGGAFVVRGSVREVTERLSSEEWAHFELAQGGDTVALRSSQVVALRGGARTKHSSIGFVHHEE
ncbi:MAG: hypothetical protein ACRDFX_07065 [Chloroflexota bacterium]